MRNDAVHEFSVLAGGVLVRVGDLDVVIISFEVEWFFFIDGGGCLLWIGLRLHLSYKDSGIYKRLFPLFDGKTYQNTLHIIKIIEIMSNLVYKGAFPKADPRQPMG